MVRDDAIVLMQEVLGFRTGLNSTIIRHLKLAQQTLEEGPTLPWFLLSEDSYTTTVADEERILVPSDMLAEEDDVVLKYVPADTTEEEVDLIKDEYDVLRKNFRGAEAGPPEYYALVGKYFRIFPTPDDTYTLRMIYYKKADLLDSNIENVWLANAPKVLMGSAGQTVAAAIRDVVAAAEFSRWEKEGRILMSQKKTDREMANRELQVGGPH